MTTEKYRKIFEQNIDLCLVNKKITFWDHYLQKKKQLNMYNKLDSKKQYDIYIILLYLSNIKMIRYNGTITKADYITLNQNNINFECINNEQILKSDYAVMTTIKTFRKHFEGKSFLYNILNNIEGHMTLPLDIAYNYEKIIPAGKYVMLTN